MTQGLEGGTRITEMENIFIIGLLGYPQQLGRRGCK
jgi:hypothetical protein